MTVSLPKVRVGDPVRVESLTLFPLHCEPQSSDLQSSVDYRLSDAGLADNSVIVEEISDSGSVPELLVENKGDCRVLFLEGEELVGAKQNRILNTSVLVAAHSKTKIPVSCVEQGRWGYESRYFGSSGSHSPGKLRYALKASVSKALKKKLGFCSDQAEIWQEVGLFHAKHGVESKTAAMSDAFDNYRERIADFQARMKYIDGAIGVAVAIADRIVSVDLFDKSSTCEKVWDRMLSGVIFDAFAANEVDKFATADDVEKLLANAGALPWEQSEAVGEGEEYRAESERGDHASALALHETVVHGSLVAAV